MTLVPIRLYPSISNPGCTNNKVTVKVFGSVKRDRNAGEKAACSA